MKAFVWFNLSKIELQGKNLWSKNWILKISVMTIFDLNIWFMVTTNPLFKCSVNVNYAPDRAK